MDNKNGDVCDGILHIRYAEVQKGSTKSGLTQSLVKVIFVSFYKSANNFERDTKLVASESTETILAKTFLETYTCQDLFRDKVTGFAKSYFLAMIRIMLKIDF